MVVLLTVMMDEGRRCPVASDRAAVCQTALPGVHRMSPTHLGLLHSYPAECIPNEVRVRTCTLFAECDRRFTTVLARRIESDGENSTQRVGRPGRGKRQTDVARRRRDRSAPAAVAPRGGVMLWLVCGVVIANALVVGAATLACRRSTRPRHSAQRLQARQTRPDFPVIDCRFAIHFVPLPEDDHDLGSSRCPCGPSKTVNRRRCGRRVVYLDHRDLASRGTA